MSERIGKSPLSKSEGGGQPIQNIEWLSPPIKAGRYTIAAFWDQKFWDRIMQLSSREAKVVLRQEAPPLPPELMDWPPPPHGALVKYNYRELGYFPSWRFSSPK